MTASACAGGERGGTATDDGAVQRDVLALDGDDVGVQVAHHHAPRGPAAQRRKPDAGAQLDDALPAEVHRRKAPAQKHLPVPQHPPDRVVDVPVLRRERLDADDRRPRGRLDGHVDDAVVLLVEQPGDAVHLKMKCSQFSSAAAKSIISSACPASAGVSWRRSE